MTSQETGTTRLSRRGLLAAFAATAVVAVPAKAGVFGILRGAGDVRRIQMYSGRTGETLDMIYWVNGDYIKPALKEISMFMRDWRENKAIQIDPRTVDIMAASHALLDVDEPYLLLSGYRTAKTNAMLRNNSRGVASNSYHIRGQAADLRLKNRSVKQMTKAASYCAAGGVGTYYGSNFVHMDSGPIRHWTG